MENRYFLHVDVNNAFLSWTAVELLKNGCKEDIRDEIAVIGGNEEKRTGIVLAKSMRAKKIGIKTGMTLYQARKLYPLLKIYPPNHQNYKKYSNMLYCLLNNYSDKIERFSVDECFLDMTGCLMGRDILDIANEINKSVKKKLGFTVNIGISDKKLLAKIASDFEKPDKIHHLFSNEISKIYEKNLDSLFMLGKSTKTKMEKYGITTIGKLANSDPAFIETKFGKNGIYLYKLANGIDDSQVKYTNTKAKGVGKDITLPKDISDVEVLDNVLLTISRYLSSQMKKNNQVAKVVCIKYRTSNFEDKIHQKKLKEPTNISKKIYEQARELLNQIYGNEPVRLIGIRCQDLEEDIKSEQISLFKEDNIKLDNIKNTKLDSVINKLNNKYGKDTVIKAGEMDTLKYF